MSTKKPVAAVVKPVAKIVATPPASVTLARSTKARKGSSIVYQIPGLPSTVKIARSAFGAIVPDVLTLVGSPFAKAVATLTKEERAALRAAMTPADIAKAARERANRAVAKAAKLEAAV